MRMTNRILLRAGLVGLVCTAAAWPGVVTAQPVIGSDVPAAIVTFPSSA